MTIEQRRRKRVVVLYVPIVPWLPCFLMIGSDTISYLGAFAIFQFLTPLAAQNSAPKNGTNLYRPPMDIAGVKPSLSAFPAASISTTSTINQATAIDNAPAKNNQDILSSGFPVVREPGIGGGEYAPVAGGSVNNEVTNVPASIGTTSTINHATAIDIKPATNNQDIPAGGFPVAREAVIGGVDNVPVVNGNAANVAASLDTTTERSAYGSSATNGTACVRRYFTDDSELVNTINGMADNYGPFIQFALRNLDAATIHDKSVGPFETEFMKTTFEITINVHDLKITGLASTRPDRVRILDPSYIRLGFKDLEVVNISGNVTVHVDQKEQSFLHPCLLSLAHPFRCPPKDITANFVLLVNDVHGLADVYVDQMACAPGAIGCSDLTMGDFVGLISSMDFGQIIDRIKTRLNEVRLKNVFIEIGQVAQFLFKTQGGGRITSAIEKHIVRKIQKSTNEKKGDNFDLAHVLAEMATKHANSYIDKISTEFGHTCIDRPSTSSGA
uniref:Uncharacterized protein AlNc14C236G9401 n=1 Tax=Albugo laibachii Nc14 TaxID=890382 RepID=F0W8B9_9STRA|nr:conserved hypothetical protein [Albugo laibachii Nc14]CCA24383.1 conserved hypothetical protein [Albugo laibachii Nc14]|eukprot:CCA24383.1 conserved hypothetical protein [Albugo laibachii Nc14]